MQHKSISSKAFEVFNYIFLSLLALACLFPLVHYLAISLSSSAAAQANEVGLWPVHFDTRAYVQAFNKPQLFNALLVTIERTILGAVIGMTVTGLAAYALSKGGDTVKGYPFYITFFIIALLFNGGLIPTYLLIKSIGIMDTIWALVLPGAVNVFNMILLINFFKALPKELEEAAFIDGASHWHTFIKIFIPLSMPAIATVGLFVIIGDWNSWFDGILYMNGDHIPLGTYLQSIMAQPDFGNLNTQDIEQLSNKTVKAAQLFIGIFPILFAYPFLQRFFVQGVVIGAVKE